MWKENLKAGQVYQFAISVILKKLVCRSVYGKQKIFFHNKNGHSGFRVQVVFLL